MSKFIDKIKDEDEPLIREWYLVKEEDKMTLMIKVKCTGYRLLSIQLDDGNVIMWQGIPNDIGLQVDPNGELFTT